ncbi:MAG: hypothetical protein EBR42_06480 [Betaproteobacteria bacterium]|nr:hypothetical protein [Betaproteobacteria bacterium]
MPLKRPACLPTAVVLFACMASFSAWGYTLTCEAQGSFPEMEKIVVKPATVEVNIESIGNHLYIKVEGPKLYGMFVNTLTTEEFKGQDLTSKTSIWIKRKHLVSQEESEIKITRQPVTLFASKDVQRYGKNLKFVVTGPCQLPA